MTRAALLAAGLTLAGLTLAGCVPRPAVIEAKASASVASSAEVAAGDALYPVQAEDGLWGYADAAGRTVVTPRFEQAAAFNEGRAAVRVDGRWGYADTAGRLVVPVLYTEAGPFSEGRARVAVGSTDRRRYGFVASDGTVVVAPTLISATAYTDGLAVVRRQAPLTAVQRIFAGSSAGLAALDRDGGVAFELPYRDVRAFSAGLAPFRGARGQWGFLDTRGGVAIAPAFEGPGFLFSEGLARVSIGGRLGFADTTGTVVVAPAYTAAGPFSEGLAAVSVRGRWGYIDRAGRAVIDPRFDEAGAFSEGLAIVRQDGLYGYIDRTGAVVIAPQFRAAQAFRGGRAVVAAGPRSVLLTPTGARVAPGDS